MKFPLKSLAYALCFACLVSPLIGLTTLGDYPFSPAAGDPDSSAIAAESGEIGGWATQVVEYLAGAEADTIWQDVSNALGSAEGDGIGVVSLGRGGAIVLSFDGYLKDGPGWDLAVFENGFTDSFLELGWVEVSSDGINFVRFPNYSATAFPVGTYGSMDTTKLYGYAGKFRMGYGTPFDLLELSDAYNAVSSGFSPFSDTYTEHLLAQFPLLDLERITHIRIVDIVGDGSWGSSGPSPDGSALPIFDPWPTFGSAGLDLDAVAFRKTSLVQELLPQTLFVPPIPDLTVGERLVLPRAFASSGLDVRYRAVEVPNGSFLDPETLVFQAGSEPGVVRLEARQEGNGEFLSVVSEFSIQIFAGGEISGPESYSDWMDRQGLVPGIVDSDADGFSDYCEYLGGSDPRSFVDRPFSVVRKESGEWVLQWSHNRFCDGTLYPVFYQDMQWDVPMIAASSISMTEEKGVRTYSFRVTALIETLPLWRVYGHSLKP